LIQNSGAVGELTLRFALKFQGFGVAGRAKVIEFWILEAVFGRMSAKIRS
jgi:hypothetical protein